MTKLTIEEKTYISEVVKYFVKRGIEITSVVKSDNVVYTVPLGGVELFFFSKEGEMFRFTDAHLCFNRLTKFRLYDIKELLEEEDE